MNKKVLIIYTGGTIGMVKTENGYAPKKDRILKELKNIKELDDDRMPRWDLYEFPTLLDSTNVTVKEWNKIGEIIFDNYQNYDGFVVLHGTDTMAYSASALAFMLKNLSKPVVFTGSQIPLCEIRSDGKDNLITSMLIAASGKVAEVCLYFGGKLLRGNRSIKVSADRLLAFDSPEFPPLATAGISVEFKDTPKPVTKKLELYKFKKVNIGVIKIFPGIQFSVFDNIMTDELDGLVIETFGTGNVPDYDKSLLPVLKKARENGTIITVCSQCVAGTVTLGAYSTSSKLKDLGVASGLDMTTEAAVAKLYFLLSTETDKEKIKTLMQKNLRGELTEK